MNRTRNTKRNGDVANSVSSNSNCDEIWGAKVLHECGYIDKKKRGHEGCSEGPRGSGDEGTRRKGVSRSFLPSFQLPLLQPPRFGYGWIGRYVGRYLSWRT